MCWLYSVPILLVIQQLDTLYLGGNHLRNVCKRVWRTQVYVRLRVHSRLKLTSDSRLMTHQSATHVKHVGSWRVMTTEALQNKKDNLASQLFHKWNLQLVTVASESLGPLFCRKITFHIPHIPYYKYPYTHKMQRASRENFER